MYARHVEDPEIVGGREPFGPEPFGRELRVERLKAEGLMGCPFDPAQGKGSPLYVNPVNVLIILSKILAEGQVLRSRLLAGERNREGPSEGSLSTKL